MQRMLVIEVRMLEQLGIHSERFKFHGIPCESARFIGKHIGNGSQLVYKIASINFNQFIGNRIHEVLVFREELSLEEPDHFEGHEQRYRHKRVQQQDPHRQMR